MLQEELRENKPSQNDRFTNKVHFFIALKTGDLTQVEACLARDPDLINAQTEWGVASEGYYWPLGVTALYWAAGVGDVKLARSLLARGAEVNAVTKSGLTPLHFAVLMRQAEMVQLLIERGAEINAQNSHGHTPLHLAAMRGNAELVRGLLSNGAATEALDSTGRKPVDWAVNKNYTELIEIFSEHSAGGITTPLGIPPGREERIPTGAEMLGRVLDERGRTIDGGATLNEIPRQTIHHREAAPGLSMLTTGIKIIDLLVPLKRGGHHGVFTPHPGVGKLVVLGQLIQNIASLYDGYTICMGLERGDYTGKGLLLGWRDWNVDQRSVLVFGQQGDPPSKRLQVIETGLAVAENFRRQDHEVLLLVDSDLALSEGVLPYLKTHAISTPQAATTTVYYGDHSAGAEPQPFTDLDTLITFEVGRARQGLWPAIDPLRSRSSNLKPELIGEGHAQLAARVRQLLWRYLDLNVIVENRGLDALSTPEDQQVVLRARRLNHFLTQPFAGAEPWTNVPGQIVSLEDTLAGCQGILDGVYDDLPEETFSFIGALEQVTDKA